MAMLDLTSFEITLAMLVTLVAGFVKGAVGFATPTIMISGLGSFLAPEIALAGLILPTLVNNVMQALRQAWALRSFRQGLMPATFASFC